MITLHLTLSLSQYERLNHFVGFVQGYSTALPHDEIARHKIESGIDLLSKLLDEATITKTGAPEQTCD